LQRERYFLLCQADHLETPAVQQALDILRSEDYRQAVDALPGYSTDDTGRVEPLSAVLGGSLPGRKAGRRA
jgi:molybdate-binding protein